jgi:hypothetical protein
VFKKNVLSLTKRKYKSMFFRNFIIACFIVLGLTMCTKRTESRIIGKWKIVTVGQPTYPADAAWTFYSGGVLNIYKDINGNTTGSVEGHWEAFSRSAVIPYIEIKGLGPKGMDGKWRVEKVNDKILIINRVEFGNGEVAGSFLRREFTKE